METVDRLTCLVLHARDEPDSIRVIRMDGHGEPKRRQGHTLELPPGKGAVGRTEDAVIRERDSSSR